MQTYQATIVDILRANQRDEAFINELQNYFIVILKLLGSKRFNRCIRYVPWISQSWYYYATSISNLQTLGEEYAGVLRFNGQNVPGKMLQFVWLVLFVFGDKIYDKFLFELKIVIQSSDDLRDEAKVILVKYINFFKEKRHVILRLHHCLFYIMGNYYNLSNRFTKMKYVLLREWMQDVSSVRSFRFLGYISLFYSFTYLVQELLKCKEEDKTNLTACKSAKGCSLCGENRIYTSATHCGHLFCWKCIHNSIKYQPNCPLCREIIDPSRMVLLQNFK